MCKKRDIILIDSYKSQGEDVSKHFFLVLDDAGGEIQGLRFDLLCNVLSSFKDEEQKARKLSYPGNFPISAEDENSSRRNKKDGYIKADQIYYFNKDLITYRVIGSMKEQAFNELIEFIENGNFGIELITDNL